MVDKSNIIERLVSIKTTKELSFFLFTFLKGNDKLGWGFDVNLWFYVVCWIDTKISESYIEIKIQPAFTHNNDITKPKKQSIKICKNNFFSFICTLQKHFNISFTNLLNQHCLINNSITFKMTSSCIELKNLAILIHHVSKFVFSDNRKCELCLL